MNFDTLLIMPLITGAIFCATGIIMYYFPPKNINALYGYRTPKSMQNQEQWDFAQIYCAKLLIKFGLVLCLSSILGCMFTIEEPFGLILSMVLLLITVVLLLIFTEKAINKKFNL